MNNFTSLGVGIISCELPFLAFPVTIVPKEMNTRCGPLLPDLVWILSWGQCAVTQRACLSCPYGNHHCVLGLHFLVPRLQILTNRAVIVQYTHTKPLSFFFGPHQGPPWSFNVANGASYGRGASRFWT